MMKRKLYKQLTAIVLSAAIVANGLAFTTYADDPDDPQIMVSMGDSYSSGEGIEPFYAQNKDNATKVETEDWLAHRSELSWSGRLRLPNNDGTMSDNKDNYWYFVASSGAMTQHIKNAPNDNDDISGEQRKDYFKDIYLGHDYLPVQTTVFDEIDQKFGPNQVDYVTLTMGGNDVDFTGVIISCVTGCAALNIGGLSDKLNDTVGEFDKDDSQIKQDIEDTYDAIANRAGPQAHILVGGYPKLLSKSGLGILIDSTEAKLVNDSVVRFNYEIEKIVEDCQKDGMNIYFVPVIEEKYKSKNIKLKKKFDGHEAYTKEPYINEIYFGAKPQDLKDFTLASAYSMHPNSKGAAVYAQCMQDKINEIENVKLQPGEGTTTQEIVESLNHGPDQVVETFFNALGIGDYNAAANCLGPINSLKLKFVNWIATKILSIFNGGKTSAGELLVEQFKGKIKVISVDVDSVRMGKADKQGSIKKFFAKIPVIRNALYTDADVTVEYEYNIAGFVDTNEITLHVRNFFLFGWRIENGYESFFK